MAEAAIDWRSFISPDDADVPLHCLRHSIKHRMALYLNPTLVVTTEAYCPDWGGLAELIGFDGLEIDDISRSSSPGYEVLNRWISRTYLNPTVGNLVRYLAILRREDILTDLGESLQAEIHHHRNRHESFNRNEQPLQDETVSSAAMEMQYSHILTIDDTMTEIFIYDAFVCYEFKDIKFVQEMIRRLEDPNNYGFKFFVPGRNNLAGTNSYELMTRIISERCRHMIVVLSNNFVQSDVCNFQSSYAFSLNPGARDKKMVPIKIEDCPIPETLRIMACCDFTNQDLLDWSWERLAKSIMRPMPNREFMGPHIWNSNQEQSHLPNSQSSTSSSSSTALPSSSRVDSGIVSNFSSLPSSPTVVASFSSKQDPSAKGEASTSQDSSNIVKSNVSRAFKRFTKSKKKEKTATTKF